MSQRRPLALWTATQRAPEKSFRKGHKTDEKCQKCRKLALDSLETPALHGVGWALGCVEHVRNHRPCPLCRFIWAKVERVYESMQQDSPSQARINLKFKVAAVLFPWSLLRSPRHFQVDGKITTWRRCPATPRRKEGMARQGDLRSICSPHGCRVGPSQRLASPV
jgi:hypothetical protein